jgi:hypothetical protein
MQKAVKVGFSFQKPKKVCKSLKRLEIVVKKRDFKVVQSE